MSIMINSNIKPQLIGCKSCENCATTHGRKACACMTKVLAESRNPG